MLFISSITTKKVQTITKILLMYTGAVSRESNDPT